MKDLIAFYRARLDDAEAEIGTECEPFGICGDSMGVHLTAEERRADIASKRAILGKLTGALETLGNIPRQSSEHRRVLAQAATLARVVRLLAAVYASHPDYRRDFAPRIPEWDQ